MTLRKRKNPSIFRDFDLHFNYIYGKLYELLILDGPLQVNQGFVKLSCKNVLYSKEVRDERYY